MADSNDKHKDAAHGHDSHGDDHGHAPELTDVIELGERADTFSKIALGVGILGIVGCLSLGGGLFGTDFQRTYLQAFMWGLSISIGALFWVTIQHLMSARASVVMRRLGEIIAQGVVILAVLSLPLLIPVAMHNPVLYSWLDHAKMEEAHVHKTWLLQPFFLGRMVFYFVYFAFFASFLLKTSVKQEATGQGEKLADKLRARSAPGMIVLALSLTFCAIDFLMTLDPIWFSTIFGVYFFATGI